MTLDLPTAIVVASMLVSGALIFFAIRVSGLIRVEPHITVQAPVAELPGFVADILQRIDAKLQPPSTPATAEALDKLADEAVHVVEGQKGLRGVDKFKAARAMVLQRAQAQNLAVEDRNVALAIEAAVALMRKPKALPAGN